MLGCGQMQSFITLPPLHSFGPPAIRRQNKGHYVQEVNIGRSSATWEAQRVRVASWHRGIETAVAFGLAET
jgi:hypothetical protein